MLATVIPYSSMKWLETIAWKHKNFSQSEEVKKFATIVFDTIKAEMETSPTRCSLDEMQDYSDSALNYRIFQIEEKLKTEENQYTAKTLIAEKYSIEKALTRR